MTHIQKLIVLAASLILAACAGSPAMETREVQVDKTYTGGAVKNVLVLALVDDARHESRVILERGFTNTMKAAGIDARPGYALFDSVDALVAKPGDFVPELSAQGIETVLFIDPVKLTTDFDPGEYATRRSAHRALGLDSAAGINAIAMFAADADAAKVVMNVGLWRPGGDDDLFNSTYDINAPGNYNIDASREYTNQFAQAVVEDLRSHGFID